DFLDTNPTSAFTEATYVKTVDELETLLYTCYSVIGSYYPENTFAPFSLPLHMFIFGNIGSDDAECWEDRSISLSMQTSDNDWTFFYWHINYYLIAKCNLVIDKSEEVEGDEEEIEIIVDQAKYLRALGYYNLVTIYGGVPVFTHWLNPDELNLERATEAEVWALIEQDLLDAGDLPKRSQWNENGRITHGAVHALLGKVYLWQERWKEAIQAYTAIIESGEYSLVDDYGLIHRHDGEHCEESILEFQQAIDVEGGPNMVTWLGNFRLPKENVGGGEYLAWGWDTPTQNLVDEFEQGDPRLLYTVSFAGDSFPTSFGNMVLENPLVYTLTGYTTRKAWIPWDERPQVGWNFEMNWRYCRYAEVLLFCAEALNENGQAAQARDYVNMVRDRARKTPIDDPQREYTVWDGSYEGELLPDVTTDDQAELRELIWKEQRVELAQEGHRRWILLRTGRFKEAMERAKGAKGCTVEDHEWLFPLPPDEVTNSFGRITQNPGYQ
ncbi:MAG: RagB/SusD family nutrient uptake outer membrane protein, partial [Bacteroidota bacterium]